MSDAKKPPQAPMQKAHELQNGHQPLQKGYQPSQISGIGQDGYKPQGGHQPTTGQGAPSTPPNQGSGVKPPPNNNKK